MIDGRLSVLELRSVRGTGGGPEKTILLGAERADRSRFAITVCYVRDERDDVFGIDAWAGRLGIDYVEVRERHSIDPAVIGKLTTLIRDRHIDIVHAHEYKTDVLALLLARRTGVIPLSTAHGFTGHSWRERYVYYPVDKWALGRFPRVIAVSSEIKQELVRHGASANRIVVMLNSIDPAAFRRDHQKRAPMRAELGYRPEEIVIGAVGRVEPQKRFDLLLEAFAPLAREKPRLRLVIAGDGSRLQALREQADRLQIREHVQFLGHRRDIAALHHAFDLFVQSSEYEGTPNAVLEAMAMETPLVATDVGGTRELARSGAEGLIVDAHDVPALRSAIDNVLSDPAGARSRADAARRRVETELSFETRTRRLEQIYEDLARERRGTAVLHQAAARGRHA